MVGADLKNISTESLSMEIIDRLIVKNSIFENNILYLALNNLLCAQKYINPLSILLNPKPLEYNKRIIQNLKLASTPTQQLLNLYIS